MWWQQGWLGGGQKSGRFDLAMIVLPIAIVAKYRSIYPKGQRPLPPEVVPPPPGPRANKSSLLITLHGLGGPTHSTWGLDVIVHDYPTEFAGAMPDFEKLAEGLGKLIEANV